MKQNTILLLFILLSMSICSCQTKSPQNTDTPKSIITPFDSGEYLDEYFILDKQLIIQDFTDRNVEIQEMDNRIFLLDKNKYLRKKVNRGAKVELIEIKNSSISKHILELPIDTWVYDFVYTPNNYLLLVDKCILIYDRNRTFVDSIHTPINWSKMFFEHEIIYLTTENFGIASYGGTPKISILNIENKSLEKYHEFKIPKGSAMTYFRPRNIFGIYKNLIYLSNITDYSIDFYDLNYNKISTISYHPKQWVSNDSAAKVIDNYNNFDKFRREAGSLPAISLIQNVMFVNDSLFIVSWNRDNDVEIIFDIWKFNKNNWEIYKKDLICSRNFDTILAKTVINDMPERDRFGFTAMNGKIVNFSKSPYLVKDYIGRKYKNYYDDVEKYYEAGEPCLSIFMYKFRDKK